MAFFRPFLSDPFFSTPSSALFSPSPSLLFDDDPFFAAAAAPLVLYDTPTARGRAGRRAQNSNGNGGQRQLKEQQAASQGNAQLMVSGGGDAAAAGAGGADKATGSGSPVNKQTAVANNNSNNSVIKNNNNSNNAITNSLRQPRLLSPLSLLSAFSPATSLLSSRAVLPSMSVDVLSTDAAYTVQASVPGVAKQDLKVTVEDGVLTIEAERREETRQSRLPSSPNSNSSSDSNSHNDNSNSKKQQQPPQQKEREEKAATETATQSATSSITSATTTSTGNNTAQPMQTEDDQSPQYHHVESFYGHISRSITLPDDCQTDSMAAKYEDGVLRIVIPRLQQDSRQRGTRLEIQ